MCVCVCVCVCFRARNRGRRSQPAFLSCSRERSDDNGRLLFRSLASLFDWNLRWSFSREFFFFVFTSFSFFFPSLSLSLSFRERMKKKSSNVTFWIDVAFVNGCEWLYTTVKKRRSQTRREPIWFGYLLRVARSFISFSLRSSFFIHIIFSHSERNRTSEREKRNSAADCSSFCLA